MNGTTWPDYLGVTVIARARYPPRRIGRASRFPAVSLKMLFLQDIADNRRLRCTFERGCTLLWELRAKGSSLWSRLPRSAIVCIHLLTLCLRNTTSIVRLLSTSGAIWCAKRLCLLYRSLSLRPIYRTRDDAVDGNSPMSVTHNRLPRE